MAELQIDEWIPAYAGMTPSSSVCETIYALFQAYNACDEWTPACVGMTE